MGLSLMVWRSNDHVYLQLNNRDHELFLDIWITCRWYYQYDISTQHLFKLSRPDDM